MADDNDIDISEETMETHNDDNLYDVGNTSVHLNMSIDSNMDTSFPQDAEDKDESELINNVNVIDYGVIDVRDTKGGIIGGNTSIEGFSMVDLTIVKTESLADDQLPSSSHHMDEPSSIYENPDSTTGVDYTPRKVDSPANVSSTQEEDNWHGNRLVLGKRKFYDTSAQYPESRLIHNLGDSFEHVASANVVLYNMQVHLDRCKRFCAPCGTLFPSRDVAKLHRLKEHNIQCNECFLIFDSNLDLINHMTWHRKKDSLKCTACQRIFDCNEDLIQHVYNFHFNIDKFSCRECNAKFTKESNLRQHELSCKKNVVLNKPLIVGKSLTVPKMNQVNDSTSGFLTKYVCKICKEVVNDKYQRKRHRRIHPEVKKHTTMYTKITQPIRTLKKTKQSIKSQLSAKTIEKDCLIPKNVLFYCPKCDCAFSKWKTADRHLDICKGITVNKKECKKCKVFVAEWITHLKQHSLSSDFQFIQLTSKNISKGLLFECPLCLVCFDDNIILHHFNKCTLKGVLITKYYCDVCKVYLPINYMTFHNMAHDKDDRFIIIKHGIINEAKLPTRKLAKPARKVTNTIPNEYNRKILLDMKEDNDDRIKLIRCSYCGLHQYVNNIHRALNLYHTTGNCRSSKYLFRSQNCCKFCGLHFSQKCMPFHKKMHTKQELKLDDFVIYDSKTGKKIAPILPETFVCQKCGVHFYIRQSRYIHKCEEKDIVACKYCDKTFTRIEIDMHINFHLYSQKHDSKYVDSTDAHVQDEDKKASKRKSKEINKLIKCPYCQIHVSGMLTRHMKACRRSNQSNSKCCHLCKIRVHNVAYTKHMFHRHNIRVNKLSKGKKYNKIDKNTNLEKYTRKEKGAEEILPTENEMHRVYKCNTCHIAYLSVAERNKHASKKCRKYDYESCISCDLIFENHKKHVAVHKNYPSFIKENIRIVEFNKESLTKYIVRQCKYCNVCLTNSSFFRHRVYCKGEQTSILVKCSKCNLYINRKIVDKHLNYHKLHKDFTPSNIKVIICGDDDPNSDDEYPKLITSGLKRKLDDNGDDSSNKKCKYKSLTKIIVDLQDDYVTNPKPSTSKRRSVTIEDPFKPIRSDLQITYDKVITKTTKKYIVFQCEYCFTCFLTKGCGDHPKYCNKVKKTNPCNQCGLIIKSIHHEHKPDFVKENITIIPVSMTNFTIYRCVRCQLCFLKAKGFHAKTCTMKQDENYIKCDICSLRFSIRSFQKHKTLCGQKNTMYVNDFDPLDCKSNNMDTIKRLESLNVTDANEVDQIDDNIDMTKHLESLNVTDASEVDQIDDNINMTKHLESLNVTDASEVDQIDNNINTTKRLESLNDTDASKDDQIDTIVSKLDNAQEESIVKSHSIKANDTVRYFRCNFCKQILSLPKSVKKHQCNLNEHGLPIGSLRCNICKLLFVRPHMVHHNYLHTAYPKKYAIENVKIIDFDPVSEQRNKKRKTSAKNKLKELLAEDKDSADYFDDPNDTYDQNTSKTDKSLNESMEDVDDTDKKTLYQCTNCKVCIKRFFYAKLHAYQLLKYKKCEKKPYLCDICNCSFSQKYIKHHIASHAKSGENVDINIVPFDTSLVQKPVSITVYRCVCSLDFIEYMVLCSHFGNCDKQTKVGKQCDDCKLNLNENQYLAHEKYHSSKTKYTFDVIEFKDDEVPVVRRLYKCRVCSCHFTIKLAALKHIEHCTNNSDSRTCSCGIKFHANAFRIHKNLYLKRHHNKEEFEIEDVKRSDSAKNSIEDGNTTNTEPSKYKIFICVSCKVSYLNYKECYEHVAMDSPSFKPIKCDLCSNTFVSSDIDQHKKDHERLNLKRNDMQKVLMRPPLADCIDGRSKEPPSNLIGPKIDLYACKQCDVNFVNISTLQKHSMFHDLQQIKTCSYCTHRFSCITLTKHINLHHLNGENANPDCFNIIGSEKYTEIKSNIQHNNVAPSNNNESTISVGKSTPAICVNSLSTNNSTTSNNENSLSSSPSITNGNQSTNVNDQDFDGIATTPINKGHTTDNLVLYKCTDCYSHYFSERSVSAHYYRKDKKVLNPIVCKYCGYSFALKLYTQHLVLHHPYKQKLDPKMFKIINYPLNSDGATTLTPKVSKKKKRFDNKKLGKVKYLRCKECNVCFLNERVFKRHCNVHEKLPDYIFLECKICHFNFQISDLAEHMKHHETLALEQTDICVEESCLVTGEVTIYLGDTKYVDDDAEKQNQDNTINSVENDAIAYEESKNIERSFSTLDDTADITQINDTIEAKYTQNLKNNSTDIISVGVDDIKTNNEESCMKTSNIDETSEDLSVVDEGFHINDESAMSIDSTNLKHTGNIVADNHQVPSDDCKYIDDDLNSEKINASNSQVKDGFKDSQIIDESKLTNDDSKLLAEVSFTPVVNSYKTTLDVENKNVYEDTIHFSSERTDNISSEIKESDDNTHCSNLNMIEEIVGNTNNIIEHNLYEADITKCNTSENLNKEGNKTNTNNDEKIKIKHISLPCKDSSETSIVTNNPLNKGIDNEVMTQENSKTSIDILPVSVELNSNDTQNSIEVNSNDTQNSVEVNSNDTRNSVEVNSNDTQTSVEVNSNDTQTSVEVNSNDTQYSVEVNSNDTRNSVEVNANDTQTSVEVNSNDTQTSVEVNSNDTQNSVEVNSNDTQNSVEVNSNDTRNSVEVNSNDTQTSVEVNLNDTQTSVEINSNDTQNSVEVNPNNSVKSKTKFKTILTTDSVKNQSENTQNSLPNVELATKSGPSALYSSDDTTDCSTQKVCLLSAKILFEDE